MARSRNIKPGFFMNDTLAEIEPLGRLLFAGLWCVADREGRLEDRPRRIKAEVLPYDDCDVDQLLSQLVTHEFIQRYQVQGEQYIQIINFSKHQNPHKNEADSVIPGPDDITCTQAPDKHSTSTVQVPDMHSTNPADSLNLIPDSLNMIPSSAQAHIESEQQPDQPPDEQRKRATKRSSLAERFDQFWDAYPKKRSKGAAEKAWAKLKPSEQLLEQMLSALEQAKTSVDWTKEGGKYIPYPATWLNAKGWEDEYQQPGNHSASWEVEDDAACEQLARTQPPVTEEEARAIRARIRQTGSPQEGDIDRLRLYEYQLRRAQARSRDSAD